MSEHGMQVESNTRRASISAVVVRCGCGHPELHNGSQGPAGPCPQPRRVDDLGVVGYFNRNPFKQLWWQLVGRRAAAVRTHLANRR